MQHLTKAFPWVTIMLPKMIMFYLQALGGMPAPLAGSPPARVWKTKHAKGEPCGSKSLAASSSYENPLFFRDRSLNAASSSNQHAARDLQIAHLSAQTRAAGAEPIVATARASRSKARNRARRKAKNMIAEVPLNAPPEVPPDTPPGSPGQPKTEPKTA